MNRPIFFYLFFSVFAFAGLICGAVGVSSLMSRDQIMSKGDKAIGTVIDLDSSNNMTAPIIGFRDSQNRSHVYHSSTYTSIDPYQIGAEVSLYYDPANPEEVTLSDDDFFVWFPFIFLFTHGGVGFGGLFWLERKRRLKNWLDGQGQEIMASFTEVKESHHKGRYFTLICTWTDPYSNIPYTFRSEISRKNPSDYIGMGALVRVLIDPANPKRYWVDNSFAEG